MTNIYSTFILNIVFKIPKFLSQILNFTQSLCVSSAPLICICHLLMGYFLGHVKRKVYGNIENAIKCNYFTNVCIWYCIVELIMRTSGKIPLLM